jgi:hemolysin III
MLQTASEPSAEKRLYSVGELLADGVVHAVAIVAGLVAFGVLFSHLLVRGTTADVIAVGIYAAGFFFMFGFSCAYNMAPQSQLKSLLRRFDRAAIYIMIAGTYTAMLAQFGDHLWAGTLLGVSWAGALAGSGMMLLMKRPPLRLSLALYLLLGWSVIAAIGPVAASLPAATLALAVIGGVIYSVGIVFYRWHSLKFQTAIWHSFVATAAGCHFAGIAYAMGGVV